LLGYAAVARETAGTEEDVHYAGEREGGKGEKARTGQEVATATVGVRLEEKGVKEGGRSF